MRPEPRTLIFAGGGTGGHLYPGIAIADEIRRRHPETDVTFVGTKGKIEERVVPAKGYPLVTIWISGFRRRLSIDMILFPLKVCVSLVQSLMLMKKKQPDAVIGTGGYVCGPVVYAAQLLDIPTVIQEQNSYPGLTTRLLAPRAKEVHLTFEHSRTYLKRQSNVHVSGNPTRDVLGTVSRPAAATFFGIDPARKTLLIFGGSLGAASINSAMLACVPALIAEKIQIVWQTGGQDFEHVREAMENSGGTVKVHMFIDKMEFAYAACDLAVCRSGASSLAEIARVGIPSILVPYPYAAADHQTENARTMTEAGASVLVPDRDAARQLGDTILTLMNDPQRLASMAGNARRLGKPEAAGILADAVLRVARA